MKKTEKKVETRGDRCEVMERLKFNVSDVFGMKKLQLATDM